MENQQKGTVFCTLIGKPNVGKSSILNALVGEKIAIVSNKPQTTRTRIQGVLTKDGIQYVFLDTPGYHKPLNKLSEYMDDTVRQSVSDTELAVFVTDFSSVAPDPTEKQLLADCAAKKKPCILAINKIDLLARKEDLLPKIEAFSDFCAFSAVVPVSARSGEQLDVLQKEIAAHAIPGPHFFPDDTLTDQPERVLMGELLREQALRLLAKEVPHGIGVVVEKMADRTDGGVDIDAVLYCERESHKGIIIGKGGEMLKKIGTNARREMERFLDCKVNLHTWVKVKENWRNQEAAIRMLGFKKES